MLLRRGRLGLGSDWLGKCGKTKQFRSTYLSVVPISSQHGLGNYLQTKTVLTGFWVNHSLTNYIPNHSLTDNMDLQGLKSGDSREPLRCPAPCFSSSRFIVWPQKLRKSADAQMASTRISKALSLQLGLWRWSIGNPDLALEFMGNIMGLYWEIKTAIPDDFVGESMGN